MKKLCFILLISTLLLSCSKDVMERTIFIPDDNDGNLPAYTEWGYNSFGAEYERSYFLASNSIVPCKILYNNDSLQFTLSGKIKYSKEMTLYFIFPYSQISEYADLVQLNNTKIKLNSNTCTVKILQDGITTTLNVLEGELYFKRTQLLSIDDMVNRVILSGTFDFRFLFNNMPTYMSNGRFDLGITKNVFYAY